MTQTAGLRRPSPICLMGGDVPLLLFSDPAKGGDGVTRINPDKSRSKWEWIAATLNGQFPISVPGTASGNSPQVQTSLTIGAQDSKKAGNFEASSILFRVTSGQRVAVTPEVRTPTLNRILSNINISSNLMSGTSQIPGLLPQSIFCLPKTNWFFTIQNLATATSSVEPVIFGRRWDQCSPTFNDQLLKRAEFLRWLSPYWIGPQDPANASYTGPEVTLAPGATAVLTFPIPSSADFLLLAFLDDSTYADNTGAGNLSLYGQVSENFSGHALANLGASSPAGSSPLGIDWSLISCPSPTVTGMPSNGIIRAFSLQSPLGGYTHLVPKNTQIVARFTSKESVNTIKLRPCLFGYLVYAQSGTRLMSVDQQANQERVNQAYDFLRRFAAPVTAPGSGA